MGEQRDREEWQREYIERINREDETYAASHAAAIRSTKKEIAVLLLFLFSPGLLGILGQKILHSVPSSILVPILIPLTVATAAYTAWFFGKKLREKLRIKIFWLFLIRAAIFLFIPLFVYVLFYRYELYNCICGITIGGFILFALLNGILSPVVKGVVSIVSPRPSLVATPQPQKPPASHLKSISFLLYTGIIMALAVQFAHANAWSLPFFKSYGDAFATSFFLVALGIGHTAYIWQNSYVGLGIVLTTIGGFAWKLKWVLPVIKTYGIPLYVGIFLILYGTIPEFVGGTLVILGCLLLSVELWLMFTKGLAAIHYGNLLVSLMFLGLIVLMFRRQKKLQETGLFTNRKTKDS
ncbi:MAG: hypothetical protein PUP90_26860 [Nostoc sp. S4]|nr:hypothetical protein [Nostoc sp. S4]